MQGSRNEQIWRLSVPQAGRLRNPAAPDAAPRQSARTRRGIVLRARRPASAARTKRCAISCSTPAPRSTNSIRSRMRSPSSPTRSPRRLSPTRPRSRKRSACKRCSTIPAPPTASCATRWPIWKSDQAATQSECLMLRQELISTQDLLKSAEATKAGNRHRRRRPPRPDRRTGSASGAGQRRQQGAARGKPAARRPADRRGKAHRRA